MPSKYKTYLVAKNKDTGDLFVLRPGWAFRYYGQVMPFVVVGRFKAESEEHALTAARYPNKGKSR